MEAVFCDPAEMQSCLIKYHIIHAPLFSKTLQFLQHAEYNLIKSLHAGTIFKERAFLCMPQLMGKRYNPIPSRKSAARLWQNL